MRDTLIPPLALAAILAASATAPATAGGDCTMETTACIREMARQAEHRGWIGIEFTSPEDLTITRVVAGGPAEEAGVRVGDVWLGLDDVRFDRMGLKESMGRVKKLIVPGARLTFRLRRGGEELALPMEPTRVPRHILAQWVGQHVLEAHMDPPPESEASAAGEKPSAPGEGEE